MAQKTFDPQVETDRKNRRSLEGLVVSKQFQFKLAVTCASLLLLPSLIAAVTFLSDLALEANAMAEAGSSASEVAASLTRLATIYAPITVLIFAICAAISIFLSLKFSNAMIGPVGRLEAQVDQMLNGEFAPIPPLRKNDYLRSLGEKLNQLAIRERRNTP